MVTPLTEWCNLGSLEVMCPDMGVPTAQNSSYYLSDEFGR